MLHAVSVCVCLHAQPLLSLKVYLCVSHVCIFKACLSSHLHVNAISTFHVSASAGEISVCLEWNAAAGPNEVWTSVCVHACKKRQRVCVYASVCFLCEQAECILYESVLLRPLLTEPWVQLCCASPCWQMIQWLYCESIVKLLAHLLSQWIQRNRLTKLLHFVLDTFCNWRHVCFYKAGAPAWKCHRRLELWFSEDL